MTVPLIPERPPVPLRRSLPIWPSGPTGLAGTSFRPTWPGVTFTGDEVEGAA